MSIRQPVPTKDADVLQAHLADIQETLHSICRKTGRSLVVTIPESGTVNVCDANGVMLRDGYLPVANHLVELEATPPPAVVAIEIPFSAAEWAVSVEPFVHHKESQVITRACRKAIEPWKG